MFLRRHGARAGALVAARAHELQGEGEHVAGALYAAIADRIGEMDGSASTQ